MQIKEEDEEEEKEQHSHSQTIKQVRSSQDTIGRGSEKTLPRHMEDSPSEVRMLSPVGKKESLLKITSKHEIIYQPPPTMQSAVSPKGKSGF